MAEIIANGRAVAQSNAIPNNAMVPYYFEDLKRRISIVRVDNRLYSFDDLCTCSVQACPLSGGLLSGSTIMCQCHGSRFDIRTPAAVSGPASKALTVYPVQEIGGMICIQI